MKKSLIKLIAAILFAALAVTAFASCDLPAACKKGEEQPQTGVTPGPEPKEGIVGEWEAEIDLAPSIIASIMEAMGEFDMDLSDAEFKNTEVTMTVVFKEDGTYKSSVNQKEVETVVNGLIENNWDVLKQKIVEFAAEEEGKAPEEITEEDVFGEGKVIPLRGISDWDSFKSFIAMSLPAVIDTKTIAKDFNCEGKYTYEGETMKMEGFYKYEDFTASMVVKTLTIDPVEPDEDDPATKVFPIVLEKTK